MKITKQPATKSKVRACGELDSANIATQDQFTDVDTVLEGANSLASAKNYIQNAIKELSNVAESNPIAKESIANLAVVLLDLEGSC